MTAEKYYEAVARLTDELDKLRARYELSRNIPEDYYEPGMMQNLEQYCGSYTPETGRIRIRTIVKGLRYDNRSLILEHLHVGDPVEILRDRMNEYNYNNFAYFSIDGVELGFMDKDLCNAIAPLYDEHYITVNSGSVSYIEQLRDRLRYAKQGVLFIEIELSLAPIHS